MRFNLALASAILLSLAALAGCGGDDSSSDGSTASVETSTVTETTTGAAETDPGKEETEIGQEPGADGDPGSASTSFFQSPSGNIGCVMSAEQVRCDIGEHSWLAPKKPADCPLDYGNGIQFAPGGQAEFTCAGDTVLGQGDTLAYGNSKTVGELTCDSAESGVTCHDVAGSGFFISKESYDFLQVDAG